VGEPPIICAYKNFDFDTIYEVTEVLLEHGARVHEPLLERENWKPNIIQLNQKLRSCIKFKADYGDTEGYVQKTTVSCTNLCWLI